MATQVAQNSQWRDKRRRVFQSVFPTDSTLQTPQSTFQGFPDQARSFGDQHLDSSAHPFSVTASSLLTPAASQPIFARQESRHGIGAGERQKHLDAAWRTVTTRLKLPSSLSAEDSFGMLPAESQFQSQDEEAEFNTALQLLIQAQCSKSETGQTYDLLAWHSQQVRSHFIQHVLPLLAALPGTGDPQSQSGTNKYHDHIVVVQNAVQTLEAALRQYFYCLTVILGSVEQVGGSEEAKNTVDSVTTRFRRDVYSLVANSAGPIMPSLHVVLGSLVAQTLQIPNTGSLAHEQQLPGGADEADDARGLLLRLVETLSQVGLAGEKFQVLFAEVMDRNMSDYVHRSYARVWKTAAKAQNSHGLDSDAAKSMSLTQTSWCILSLCDWVQNDFSRLALEVLGRVDRTGTKPTAISMADVQQWREIGVGRIAALRISELFDIVLQWPASKGALDDLKASVTTTQRRWQLTDAFSSALQQRLLHPARSTLDILRVYISMIRTFHALDHSKVLLSRVVPSLQRYLVQREDAVRIVVRGLLASAEEVEKAQKSSSSADDTSSELGGRSEKLVELAVLLNDPDQQRRMDVDEEDLDWDDMNWVPDPVDAGVNYKRPKSEDVIGTLISTLGAEEVFIKEFQSIMAEHLLSTRTDFAQEQKVMDLLKKRFGESALQNCEVMIKDIYDSRKVDTQIRRVELGQPARPPTTFGTPAAPPAYIDMGKQLDVDEEKQGLVPYHSRILSRLYWPNIIQETFNLPEPVAEQQKTYELGYQRLKSARKLTWLHQLGQAKVELELEDRTVEVDCKTFEAAVIYSFQADEDVEESSEQVPVRRTAQELQEKLQMDEELVLQALDFWESKEVLTRLSHDAETYVVLERRDSPPVRPELHPSLSAPGALEGEHGLPSKPAAVKRAGTTSAMDAKEKERRAVYWQFIVGMLTNSMPLMPLAQMAMMMRMLIPDGFPWSDQELQEFLAEKVDLGELEISGGKYKLVRK